MANIVLLLLAAHMVGDFIAQTGWMASNKFVTKRRYFDAAGIFRETSTYWFSAWARTVHVLCYTACFVPVMLATSLEWRHQAGFLLLLFALHWITDCRRWASGEQWPPKPILVDQTLHLVQIAVLAWCFGI